MDAIGTGPTHELASPPDPRGRRLLLRFAARDSRYGHQVVVVADTGETVLLQSADDALEPPSGPPLQQLHVESRDRSDVLLGVGQSGRNHWSAALESRTGSSHIDVQLACRMNRPLAWAGSTYRVVDGHLTVSHGQVKIMADGGQLGLRLSAMSATTTIDVGPGDRQFRISTTIPDRPGPATLQWHYRLEPV